MGWPGDEDKDEEPSALSTSASMVCVCSEARECFIPTGFQPVRQARECFTMQVWTFYIDAT